MSRNLRSQLARRERGLRREHHVRFRVCDDGERFEADHDALLALHEARWGGRSRSFSGPRRELQRDFNRRALERGWLRLHLLELDGRPAAALLNYRFGGVEWHRQAGRDPAQARHSLGLLLHAEAIRGAAEDGVREYRLLRGGEPYKDRFADHDRPLETTAVARGLAGRLYVERLRRARGLPRRLRSMVEP